MKIAIALHSCMDLGGIINHTEQLVGGFKDLGHECNLFEIVYKDTAPSQNKSANERLETGIPVSQWSGWCFPSGNRLPYKTLNGLNKAKETLESHDLVIWTVPVPPKNKENYQNRIWPELYDLKTLQIAISHDGNGKDGYPHILRILDHIDAVVCVHECSFNNMDYVGDTNRFLIMNPQDQPVEIFHEKLLWEGKMPGFINFQNFKAWKHVDDLIRAIIEMPPYEEPEYRDVAGMGIEYQYMTSQDKCKEQYFKDGERIWDLALANGMRHHKYWGSKEVMSHLCSARVVIDPSWSKKYANAGAHWNRVAVEGMMNGCIVVAHNWGMSGIDKSSGGLFGGEFNPFFKAGEHYIDIGNAENSKEYADIIVEAWNMSKEQAKRMQDSCREKLVYFDRKNVAKQYLQAVGLEHGFDGYRFELEGAVDFNQVNKCNKILTEHYGLESI